CRTRRCPDRHLRRTRRRRPGAGGAGATDSLVRPALRTAGPARCRPAAGAGPGLHTAALRPVAGGAAAPERVLGATGGEPGTDLRHRACGTAAGRAARTRPDVLP